MCGIVLAGGNLFATEADIFSNLLYADVFRGIHATGVYAKRGTEGIVMAKDAVPSYTFLNTKAYKEVLTGKTTANVFPSFIVGHNRHATRGNSDDPKGAHPFQHGKITLVHNGTLYDTSHLPEHEKFVVDSENICYSIDKIGAEATIQKLDGAFTLIWHDANDETVHIIRNSERPFHLAKAGADWFGASEEEMLMWILNRSKSVGKRKIEHFECEVGVEYIFDVSGVGKKFELKSQVKHTLPTFTYASRYGALGSGWQNSYGNKRSYYPAVSQEERKATANAGYNAIAIRNGLKVRVDHRVDFIPTSFFPYSNNSNVGKMMGYFMDNDTEYLEVDVFGVKKELYDESQRDLNFVFTGTVQSIIELKPAASAHSNRPIPRLIVTGISLLSPEAKKTRDTIDEELTELADDVPFEHEGGDTDSPDSFRTIGGTEITRDFWMKHDHGVCMGCNKTIPWSKAKDAAYAYQAFWHPECLARTEKEEADVREQSNNTFYCGSCGSEKDMKFLDTTASAKNETDTCSACGSEERRRGAVQGNDYVTASFKVSDSSGNVKMTSRVFNRREFEHMIRERGSDSVEFKNLADANITLRGSNVFAYFYKKDGSHKAVAKEETSTQAGSFPTAKFIKKSDGTSYKVSKALWLQIGSCVHCRSTVPWIDVEKCSFTENGKVVCKDCKGE